MGLLVTLLPLFVQALPELFKLAEDSQIVAKYLFKTKETFEKADVWTDEADAAWTKELENRKINPEDWAKTDEQLGK